MALVLVHCSCLACLTLQTLLALLGPFTLYSLGAKVLSFHFELNQNDTVTTITNLFTFFLFVFMFIYPPVLDGNFRLKLIQQLVPQSFCFQVHNLLHDEPAENNTTNKSYTYYHCNYTTRGYMATHSLNVISTSMFADYPGYTQHHGNV